MTNPCYVWHDGDGRHALELVHVPGTKGVPYLFGGGSNRREIEVAAFQISTTPVTQALWTHVMGSNPAKRPDSQSPVENVSWDHINEPGGFLDRINASKVLPAVAGNDTSLKFRLPTETEWEYAARGGPQWTDNFAFAGGNDIDAVAWYGGLRYSPTRWAFARFFRGIAWTLLAGRNNRAGRTHDVATKQPNQLGIYDMSGNVWEWCADTCNDDLDEVPRDGSPCLTPSADRRLRGGDHTNWDIFCQVSWRYGIVADAHDGCIGFRLVLAPR